ncbi:MAG: carboxynorspermidine decarboxylase [Akkermansia sp.]|nr:carboxynorspermidine decarboxylase [Akkermansia sp.]
MASFLISQPALEQNARVLAQVAQKSGAHMLLALKAFSTTSCFSTLRPFAAGCCASGLYEARLAAQHMGGHVAVYSPAYRPAELEELLGFAHHIDFNSIPQWQRYREQCLRHPRVQSGELLLGLRVNPCFSTGHTPLYDPCVPGSRLGIPPEQLVGADLTGISGLHFHTLCEQGAQELVDTFRAFEKNFGTLLASPQIRYLNMGGGHWITKPNYDREALISLVREVRECYGVEVYLEPGEAWCVHTGVLRARVLDVFESLGYRHAILDVSASAHMPDVLEMPYRPDVYAVRPAEEQAGGTPAVQLPGESYAPAGEAGELPYTYRLGAPTCLAGDVIGDFSFAAPLQPDDEIVLDDMTHYTIVKTTHFNGVPHPALQILQPDGSISTVCRLDYADFERRLG